MNVVIESAAATLNRACDCSGADLEALRRQVDAGLGSRNEHSVERTHPHLFTDTPVFLEAAHVRRMHDAIEAIESVVRLPAYVQTVLADAPANARFGVANPGVFLGYDFHIAPDGPRLIEINTNAGGGILLAFAEGARRRCCPEMQDPLPGRQNPGELCADIVAMFREEWRLARGSRPLRSVAIVDDAPQSQYLYPEFLLAQSLFEAQGIHAVIADASSLEQRAGVLHAGDVPVDLVYNRLTDFYFEDPRYQVLREAYARDLAVITPHPRAHALYASKCNLARLGDAAFLERVGVSAAQVEMLRGTIPATQRVTGEGERWWNERRHWFFKPRRGFGSRGSYRGEKLTRRVHQDVMKGDYIAQRFTPPAERWKSAGGVRQAFKFDVRCYVYGGRVRHIAARLYQGQTTNFRSAGGGFAPVYVYQGAIPG